MPGHAALGQLGVAADNRLDDTAMNDMHFCRQRRQAFRASVTGVEVRGHEIRHQVDEQPEHAIASGRGDRVLGVGGEERAPATTTAAPDDASATDGRLSSVRAV